MVPFKYALGYATKYEHGLLMGGEGQGQRLRGVSDRSSCASMFLRLQSAAESGRKAHGEKHMQPREALCCLERPAMAGKSLSGGSRSSTMMEVSSLRPPCALSIAFISLWGASCSP